ncbi:MAG: FtsX-like permease family protein [Longimicrobiales bacterium]
MNQAPDDSIRTRAREQWNRVVAWVRRRPRRAVAIGVGAVLLFLLLRWLIPDAVGTVTLESRPVVETLVTTGRVRSVSRTDVGSPLVGTVDRVFVQEGDRVSAGELLFVLDDAELRAAADEARSALRVGEAARGRVATVELPSAASALDAAQLEAEQLARDVERMRVLFDAGGVSRQELEVAQREAEAAEARLARARASAVSFAEGGADRASADAAVAQARDAVDAALARLELTRVRAPASGTVLIRDVEPGDAVQPGAVLMQIALDGPTELIVFPDERSLGDLREGQPALASADPFPDRSFDAAVTRIAPVVESLPGVVAVAPTVAGPAMAVRGPGSGSVAVRGIEPESYGRIVDIDRRIVEGSADLPSAHALIGTELATDLGLGIGDRIRLQTGAEQSAVYTIEGIFDFGAKELNERWVFIPLRAAQTMFGLEGGVSTIEVVGTGIFEAEALARRIGERTGLRAESWMATNAQLLVALRSQGSSSIMIQAFVILAVALGIASVLAVSVVQKAREIGILRATGTSTGKVVRVFLIQGGLLGVGGAIVGIAIGTLLALFFANLAQNPDGSPTFPVALTPQLFARALLTAVIVGILSAALPARRAARLDPADAIRNG